MTLHTFLPCCLCTSFLLFLGSASLQGQTATDLNEGLLLVKDNSTELFTLSWWAKAGRSYFVQTSTDLLAWSYLPLVEGGTGAVAGIQFTCTETRRFWRLRYTDAPNSGDAETADFDADGVQNLLEVTLGTDPFVSLDANSNGVPDDLEAAHLHHVMHSSLIDTDGDGVSNNDELLAGTDPRDWRAYPGASDEAVVELSVYTPLTR